MFHIHVFRKLHENKSNWTKRGRFLGAPNPWIRQCRENQGTTLLLNYLLFLFVCLYRNSLSLILGILFTIVGFFLSCVAFLVYVSKEDDKDAPPHDDNNGADLYSQHSSEYNTGNQSPRVSTFLKRA